jgi:hypothetical protein
MNFFVTFGLDNSLLRERPPFLKHPVCRIFLIHFISCGVICHWKRRRDEMRGLTAVRMMMTSFIWVLVTWRLVGRNVLKQTGDSLHGTRTHKNSTITEKTGWLSISSKRRERDLSWPTVKCYEVIHLQELRKSANEFRVASFQSETRTEFFPKLCRDYDLLVTEIAK